MLSTLRNWIKVNINILYKGKKKTSHKGYAYNVCKHFDQKIPTKVSIFSDFPFFMPF